MLTKTKTLNSSFKAVKLILSETELIIVGNVFGNKKCTLSKTWNIVNSQ